MAKVGWTASERKRSWRVCRRLETGSRQWIGQRTLFKLVGQGGVVYQAQNGQEDSSSNIRQGNAGLKCVSLNARSIMNKKSELNIMVLDSDPHIIGITEYWANKDITDAELGLEGYVMFRKDRMGRRGGGVLLYVKGTIPAYEIQLPGTGGSRLRRSHYGNIQWDTLESTGVEDQQFMCLIQDNFLIQHNYIGTNQRRKGIIFSYVFAERIC